MRTLCSIHIFKEVAPDVFANNSISAALVSNEPLTAYILLLYGSTTISKTSLHGPQAYNENSGFDLYSASDHLPKTLSNPIKGPSYDVAVTPWQDAIGTTKSRWEWLGEKTTVAELKSQSPGYPGCITPPPGDENSLVTRPELDIFGLAMVGGGHVFGVAHIYGKPLRLYSYVD